MVLVIAAADFLGWKMKIEKIGSCHGTNFVIIAVTRGCRYEHLIVPRHDDVIKWKHFPRYWPFVRGIYRSPVNSPHKGHYREAGDLRRHRTHYDVIVMCKAIVSIMATIAGMAHRTDWLSEDQFIKRQTTIRICTRPTRWLQMSWHRMGVRPPAVPFSW